MRRKRNSRQNLESGKFVCLSRFEPGTHRHGPEFSPLSNAVNLQGHSVNLIRTNYNSTQRIVFISAINAVCLKTLNRMTNALDCCLLTPEAKWFKYNFFLVDQAEIHLSQLSSPAYFCWGSVCPFVFTSISKLMCNNISRTVWPKNWKFGI